MRSDGKKGLGSDLDCPTHARTWPRQWLKQQHWQSVPWFGLIAASNSVTPDQGAYSKLDCVEEDKAASQHSLLHWN